VSDAHIRWASVLCVAALGLYCLARVEFTYSITHFIPDQADAERVQLSIDLVDSPLSRRMLLAITDNAGRAGQAEDAAAALADELRGHAEVAWVETAPDARALRDIYELYFARRVYLASGDPSNEIPRWLEPDALEQRAAQLRSELAGPRGQLVARTAPADPLGLFDTVLARLSSGAPGRASAAAATTPDAPAIVVLGLASSAFDAERQRDLLAAIDRAFEGVNGSHGGGLRLEMSGANRVAVESEKQIRSDIDLISVLSISLVGVLFLLVFRSLRALLIAFLTPLAGFVAAMASALWLAEPVHGITLGFGFVLLGVAIDYPIHLMNHHAMSAAGTLPRESLRRIRASLLLSGLTTTLAFGALASSDLPGLSAMGSFAAIGVPVSLAVTLLVVPAFLAPSRAPTRTQRALGDALAGLVVWLRLHRSWALSALASLVAVAAVGLPRLEWSDDPASLMATDPELIAEADRVRRQVADYDGGRFVVALAQDREAALAVNDRIYTRLDALREDGALDGILSLHSFVWSEQLQLENLASFRNERDLAGRIDRAFASQGFRAGSFGDFEAELRSPSAAPLRPADLEASPLAHVLDSLVELDGRWAVVTYLRGSESGDCGDFGERVEQALSGIDGAYYLDQGQIVGDIYQGYRVTTVRLLAFGSALAFGVLFARYRGWRPALLAFLPSGLAALATFGLFGLLGVTVNLISAISLLVVIGMGVDYGVFSVDGARHADRLHATLPSLTVSCLTSVFVFGTLAFSSQPALRAIGLTTGVGVLLALAIAPLMLAIAPRDEPDPV